MTRSLRKALNIEEKETKEKEENNSGSGKKKWQNIGKHCIHKIDIKCYF